MSSCVAKAWLKGERWHYFLWLTSFSDLLAQYPEVVFALGSFHVIISEKE